MFAKLRSFQLITKILLLILCLVVLLGSAKTALAQTPDRVTVPSEVPGESKEQTINNTLNSGHYMFVRVTIHAVRDLNNADTNSPADMYPKVRIDGRTFKKKPKSVTG